MTFRNPIVAGTILVIEAIQSPNYTAGSSGWIIRQDGSVEFANAVLRGSVVIAAGPNQTAINLANGQIEFDLGSGDTQASISRGSGSGDDYDLTLEYANDNPDIGPGRLILRGLDPTDVYDPDDANSDPKLVSQTGTVYLEGPPGLTAGDCTLVVSGDTYVRSASPANLGVIVQPTGMIMAWPAAGAVPRGWLECDGAAVSRFGDTSALFALIGTTYGAGDGSTTFNLPDLRGRAPFGHGGGISGAVGATGGSVQQHARTAPLAVGGANGSYAQRVTVPSYSTTHRTAAAVSTTTQSTTSGSRVVGDDDTDHALPPYMLLRWLIAE